MAHSFGGKREGIMKGLRSHALCADPLYLALRALCIRTIKRAFGCMFVILVLI